MTDDLDDLHAILKSWCQSYVTAFSSYDAKGVGDHWAFPALIIHENVRLTFKSADHFLANTSALLAFYQRQGVAKAERHLLSCMNMDKDAASMRVHDIMLDESGVQIVEWKAAYVLHLMDGAWRAVFAVSNGEADAWRARGTPIGS